MTAAPYTFTLSAAQSSATSMVVAMRAKIGSSIPGTAARWQGGVMPQATLNFAAGVTTATVTVNTAPNATVDGNAEYEWYKVSSTPSDLSLDTSGLPTVTIVDDDTSGGGGPTVTYVYGPVDGGADSGTINIQSTRQQCGRTWRSGAQRWKVVLGQTADGNGRTGLQILFKDDAGALDYFPVVETQAVNANTVTVAYTGAAPSASEPFTYIVSDATSIRYYCATTQAGANSRLLATIPYSIWDNATFWGSQAAADRVPSTYAQSNAEAVVANGIYAARLGAIQ